jgi:hypothetical protein
MKADMRCHSLHSGRAKHLRFVPYVSAARHSSIEHARVNRFGRILASRKSSLFAKPISVLPMDNIPSAAFMKGTQGCYFLLCFL